MSPPSEGRRQARAEALRHLGIGQLALLVQDAALPARPDEDVSHGTPYSEGALDLFRFAATLGFDAVLLARRGPAPRSESSPEARSWFAQDPLTLALRPLTLGAAPLLSPAHLQRLVHNVPSQPGAPDERRADLTYARSAIDGAIDGAWRAFSANPAAYAPQEAGWATFRADPSHAGWLRGYGDFVALAALHDDEDWRRWPPADQKLPGVGDQPRDTLFRRLQQLRHQQQDVIDCFVFTQFLLHQQHEVLRRALAVAGLRLLATRPAAPSPRDAFIWQLGSKAQDARTAEVTAAHERHLAALHDGVIDETVAQEACDTRSLGAHPHETPRLRVASALARRLAVPRPVVAVLVSDLLVQPRLPGVPIRLPADFAARHAAGRMSGQSLDLDLALALALLTRSGKDAAARATARELEPSAELHLSPPSP